MCQVEDESHRLKQLVAEQALDIALLERPHSVFGDLIPEEFTTSYGTVENKERFPHSRSRDGGCEQCCS